MEENYKKRDTLAILAYLRGKEKVEVKSIMERSGAESLRVYPILMELSLSRRLRIDEENDFGAPVVVTLIK